MKIAVVIMLLLMFGVSGARAQEPPTQPPQPRPQRISVAAKTVIIRETHDVRSDVQLFWNRNISPRPLGHSVLSCYKLGKGGLLGGGLFHCIGTYVFPLGKIMTQGLVHSHNRYTLAITGGSGRYATVNGQLFVRRVGPGVQRFLFALIL